MGNVKIYINNCRKDVISKLQIEKNHAEYNIGKTMFLTSDKGKERNHQEDSGLILEHTQDNNFKLIAVADGLGGHCDGDLASNHTLKELIYWFESLEPELQNNIEQIKKLLRIKLKNIMYDLDASLLAATTLSMAVIGKNQTLIANIGDSRIYSYTNNKLKQETRDDSEVQTLLEEKTIIDKELTRFYKSSNVLYEALTIIKPFYMVSYKTIDNNYDKLIALTDGVTDCLSTEELTKIIKTSKNKEIADNIVKNSLESDSYIENIISTLSKEKQDLIGKMQEIYENDYYKIIKAGKDNATAAVYIRK